jgi:hypothetical protein
MLAVKRGDVVIKLMTIAGSELAATATVAAVCKKRGLVSTDTSHVKKASDIQDDGVCTYRMDDGRAVANYLPGCTSRIVAFEG